MLVVMGHRDGGIMAQGTETAPGVAARGMLKSMGVAVIIGIVAGVATRAFLVAEHWLIEMLWHELPAAIAAVPERVVGAAVIVVMTALATAVVAFNRGRPFDTGAAEHHFDETGRIDYRHVPAGVLYSLLCLGSGAAVGPEAPLTDMTGGIGTLVAERVGMTRRQVALLTYAGVAGAFSAFFGVAPVGALLALEVLEQKALALDKVTVAMGLASGASAWAAYFALGGGALPVILTFPDYDGPRLWHLGLAVVIGLAGAVLGMAYGAAFVRARSYFEPVRLHRPWLAGLAGGLASLAALAVSPYLLFSGQSQLADIFNGAAEIGVLLLIALGVGKLAMSVWGLSTAYFGGPIFPIIFAGTCFGLALHLVAPWIPAGVAVLATITALCVAATAAPLSITLLFALVANPALLSVTALAAVTAWVVRQSIAPTAPGVYRLAVGGDEVGRESVPE